MRVEIKRLLMLGVMTPAVVGCGGGIDGYWGRDRSETARVGDRAEAVRVFESWQFDQGEKGSYGHTVQYFVSSSGRQFPHRMEAGTYTLRGDSLIVLRDRLWERAPGTAAERATAQDLRPVPPTRVAYAVTRTDSALVLGGCEGAADCASLSGAYRPYESSTYFENLKEANRRPPTSFP